MSAAFYIAAGFAYLSGYGWLAFWLVIFGLVAGT